MRATNRQIVVTVFILFCAGATFATYKIWRTNHQAAYNSCIASLTDVIWRQKETQQLAERNPEWKTLSADEFESVIKNVRSYDCAGFDNPRLDPQKNRINIALRMEQPDRWPPIVVWSNGPEALSEQPTTL